jgi:hypothetical protein
MQNQITADVAECRAKKISSRLLTIKLAAERINHIREHDTALMDAVTYGVAIHVMVVGSSNSTIFMEGRRYMVAEPKAHPGYAEPQPNHPDGWYRKFEKRQRGPKCLV